MPLCRSGVDMTRTRLRPKHSDEVLRQIYATPHDHTQWADHLLRVEVTTKIAQWVARQKGLSSFSMADLSCGDAAIANAVGSQIRHLGDFAPGYQYTGPIEKTIYQIPDVDMFICSETIEHLNDPDEVLYQIGQKAQTLIVSTPVGETNDNPRDENVEHYWGWDIVDVVDMLENAGWEVIVSNVLELPGWTYDYQIHGCRRQP